MASEHRSKQKRSVPQSMRIRDAAFDLRKTGVSRFDFRDPYHIAVTLSWPAFFIGAISVLATVNALFAVLYALRAGAVSNLNQWDFLKGFFFSIETLATVGYGEMAPASIYGHAVAAVEIILGMSTTAIFTGLLFVRFSKPRAHILFADKAVVTPRNGIPTLMLRIANSKLTMLTHATAKVTVIMIETTDEGHVFRRVIDLGLVRNELPIFPLTWTLMHPIDEKSAIYGLSAEDLKRVELRVFVAIDARDQALGTQIQDIGAFRHDQIMFGKKYAEAVSVDEQGRTIADLARLSLIED